MKSLHFIGTELGYDTYTEIYHDEEGNRYDFVYEFKGIKTKDENGNWVEFDGEYEMD